MVWRAGQREDGPGLNEEVLAVIPMHPVTEDHTLLVPGHHQVPHPWRPVECCDGVLEGRRHRELNIKFSKEAVLFLPNASHTQIQVIADTKEQ